MNIFLQAIDGTGGFMEIYKYVLIVALLIVFAISAFLVIGLGKARKDEEKRLSLQEKQVKLAEESLEVLKDMQKYLGGNNVAVKEDKSA
jgi:hypothetical protein